MKFSEIVNEIKKLTTIRVISTSYDADITKVKLWEKNPGFETDSTLYFGYSSQPKSWPNHFILASNITDTELEGTFANLALIPEYQFASIFNKIQDILAERTKDDYRRYLTETADTVHSVDALIDLASQTFNASLILIDRDFRILSYSSKVPVTDKLWMENIKKGYCDYEFITAVKNLRSVQMADQSITPFEVTCSSSPYRKFACRVYCKGSWIGSLLLIEGDKSYRPEHVEMLRMLSSVTGYSLLAHSPDLLHKTSDYQSFLYNLLIGTPLENLPEAYRDMTFPENTRLMYFRSETSNTPSLKLMSLQDAFNKALPGSHVITYRKATIVVGKPNSVKHVKDLLDLFPPESEISVGISNPFQRIELLRKALDEARDALTVGKSLAPRRRVFPFAEFSVSVMLNHLSETDDITRYLHPAATILAHYDDENDAKLLQTLKEYLNNNCNIKETARVLYLHRNSVIYRLHKAEEISGIDLDNPDTRFALRMAFHILEVSSQ